MRHRIPHQLGLEAAAELLGRAFAHYNERHPAYRPRLHFRDPHHATISLIARGIEIVARLELRPNELLIEMDVPLLLRPLQGVAVRAIDREAARWLAAGAKAGEPGSS